MCSGCSGSGADPGLSLTVLRSGRRQAGGSVLFAAATEKQLSAEQGFASLMTVMAGHPRIGRIRPCKRAGGRSGSASFGSLRRGSISRPFSPIALFSNSPVVNEVLKPSNWKSHLALGRDSGTRGPGSQAPTPVYGREARPGSFGGHRLLSVRQPLDTGTQDLVWALVTSAEFQFIH